MSCSYQYLFEFLYLSDRIVRPQNGRSGKYPTNAPPAHFTHICRALDAGFAHGRYSLRYEFDEPLRRREVHLQGLEVAIVDADKFRFCVERLLHVFLVVHFHERFEPQFLSERDEARELFRMQRVGDEKKCVGTAKERLIHLVLLHDEIFAEDCLRDDSADLPQKVERAPEIFFIREDRYRIGIALRVPLGDLCGRAHDELSRGGRPRLYFRDEDPSLVEKRPERPPLRLEILGFFLERCEGPRSDGPLDFQPFICHYFVQDVHCVIIDVSMVLAKICGIKNSHDAQGATVAGADFLGFHVELHGGRSLISADEAAKIITALPESVTSVVVTSVAEPERLIELAQTTDAKVLQLYGDATPEAILEVKAALPAVQVWKVINISGSEALQKAQTYESAADCLALDSAPKAGRRGGTGETHDWGVSKKIVSSVAIQ